MTTLKTILRTFRFLAPFRKGEALRVANLPSFTGGARGWVFSLLLLLLTSCDPEPPLHLYDSVDVQQEFPTVELDLEVYWDYELAFGIEYNWKAEWLYGWDDDDRRLFGELGYTMPTIFEIRRYYTGSVPYAPHTSVQAHAIQGNHFQGEFEFGFWDILCWNQVTTLDGVQSLNFEEKASLDSVTAYTNPSMRTARYQAPAYTNAFYEPEPLFAAYERAIEINENLDGFIYDPARNLYVRTLNIMMYPITYIYLTQVILHHNNGKVTSIEGVGNLSGMARTTTLNNGRGGDDAITLYYGTRMKKNCPLVPYGTDTTTVADAPRADIIGGRLMTFGLCGTQANLITHPSQLKDPHRHYMDVNMQFFNGNDSTFVFDVTDQVRNRYKGGVITVELDMDTVRIPPRPGGSGFDAVVKDFEDGGTWIIDM